MFVSYTSPSDFTHFSDIIVITSENDCITRETYCPDCKDKADENDLIDSDGHVICSLCGLVLKNIISDMAEWSNYVDSCGNSTNNSRCGSSTNTTDINPYSTSMTSFIPKGVKNVCFQEGKIVKYDIYKVHIKNSFNHLQKSFNVVEDYIDNITNDKYAKKIATTAKILWGEIMKAKKVTRAGVRKGLIACCLYYSFAFHDCIKTPVEICKDFGITNIKQFNKGEKEFIDTFKDNEKWSHILEKTSNSEEYFGRLCSDLEMNYLIKEGTAFQLAKECRELYRTIKNELIGLYPKSAACGIIFYVMKKNNLPITKSNISKTLEICNPTLSKTCQQIKAIMDH